MVISPRVARLRTRSVHKEADMTTRMSRAPRSAIVLGSFVTASVLLAGCTGGGTGGSSSGDTTLDVMVGAKDISDEQIAAFEKDNPGIKIKLILYDLTPYLETSEPRTRHTTDRNFLHA